MFFMSFFLLIFYNIKQFLKTQIKKYLIFHLEKHGIYGYYVYVNLNKGSLTF